MNRFLHFEACRTKTTLNNTQLHTSSNSCNLSYRLPYAFACTYGPVCPTANCPHQLLLSAADRWQVQETARRIAAVQQLAATADAHFNAAAANHL